MALKKTTGINTLKSGCLLLTIDSKELPEDTQITYSNGKILIRDSDDNTVEFETNELTILHSKTIVVNSSAYIITAPNIKHLAGYRYYVKDGELRHELLPDDDDADDNTDSKTTHTELHDSDFEGRCDGVTCNCDGSGCDFEADETDSDESD